MDEIDKKAIAREVRRFQYEIWQRADRSHNTVPHLLQLFRPEHAASVHGFEYEVAAGSIGIHGVGKDQYQVAGLVDVERGVIKIAGNFPYEVQRFTGAHELGHMILHPGMALHRDRPLLGETTKVLDRREQEANHFAACFLAPEKLVRQAFRHRFGTDILHLDDTAAFALAGIAMQDLLRATTGSLEFPRAVANAKKFGPGNHFKSLANEFGMSATAMAIRIHELELVSY